MKTLSSAPLLALALAAGPARADFTHATTPPWRGAPGTERAGWESFTDGYLGENAPDLPATTSGAVLVQTRLGGQITGSGNLYNPVQASRFEVRDAADCDLEEVWLQVSTWGVALDPSSAELLYASCDGGELAAPAPEITVLASYPNPGGMGLNEELLFRWDLAEIHAPVLEYTLRFDAEAAHLSLDAVLLDVRTDCASQQECQPGTPYCFGDGSGATCPCFNPGAPGRGCANGSGSDGSRLAAEGSRSLAAADLVLRAEGVVPNQPGLFFQGDSRVNNGAGSPFGDGLRCAGGNVVRLETRFANASGELATSTDLGARGGVAAGETKRYQLWYRDPQTSPCGSNFNFTNGVEVAWLP